MFTSGQSGASSTGGNQQSAVRDPRPSVESRADVQADLGYGHVGSCQGVLSSLGKSLR